MNMTTLKIHPVFDRPAPLRKRPVCNVCGQEFGPYSEGRICHREQTAPDGQKFLCNGTIVAGGHDGRE